MADTLKPHQKQFEITRMIQDEFKWDSTFEQTYLKLDKLSEEAIKENGEGKTSDKGWG